MENDPIEHSFLEPCYFCLALREHFGGGYAGAPRTKCRPMCPIHRLCFVQRAIFVHNHSPLPTGSPWINSKEYPLGKPLYSPKDIIRGIDEMFPYERQMFWNGKYRKRGF